MLTHGFERCVLHVAALADGEAMEVVMRTGPVIASQRVGQVLLALDEGGGGEWAGPAAAVTDIRRLRCSGLSIGWRIRALHSELVRVSSERVLCAVHLHGVGPCLLGSQALKGSELPGRVLYTPRPRDLSWPWAAALLGGMLRRQLAPFRYAPLAASFDEAPVLSRVFNRSAEVLPPQVSDVFFAQPREEPARPEVMAEGVGAGAVELLTRLAVLLNGREHRVQFSWLGVERGAMRAKLEAAGVRVLDAVGDRARAHCLSRATAFIYASPSGRCPLPVAQAMAAGVACLVSDIPSHRGLVHHGETGLVCTSVRDFLEPLVQLLRDPAARSALGQAAKDEASRRFTSRHFQAAVLRAYGLPAMAPLRPAQQAAEESFV